MTRLVSKRQWAKQPLRVLEPSAGRGDLLDAYLSLLGDGIDEHNRWADQRYEELRLQGKLNAFTPDLSEDKERELASHKAHLLAVEIDPDLQSVLMGKGYSLVGTNVFEYSSYQNYDLVLMNPPFGQGVRHLLYVWENLRFKNLVCILNAESVRNPCDRYREQLAKIIQDNGFTVEYHQEAFAEADRRTNVDVAVIYMTQSQASANLFDDVKADRLAGFDLNEQVKEVTDLAKPDVIGNLVMQYRETVEEYVLFRRAARRMAKLEDQFYWHDAKGERLQSDDSAKRIDDYGTDEEQFAKYVDRLTRAAWSTVFKLTKVEKRMTEKVKEALRDNQQRVGAMAFTEENVYTVIQALIQNSGQIMEQCAEDVFDFFTRYYEDNRVYFEGWKTNDAYEVGSKVVLPNMVGFSIADASPDTKWDRDNDLNDIDRVMCFFAGKKFETMEAQATLVGAIKAQDRFGGKEESEFFHLRTYKKGTLHLEFKDEKLRQRLNKLVASKRNWLKAWEAKYQRGTGGKVKETDLTLF